MEGTSRIFLFPHPFLRKLVAPPNGLRRYTNYTTQGELFELVTAASLEKLLPTWKIHRTGWAPDNPTKIATVVREVSEMLLETQGEIEPWVSSKC